MKNWKDTLISPEASLRDALEVIDRAGSQIALVVNERTQLLGTVSDGDVRRALLRGLSIETRAAEVMNTEPTCANAGADDQFVLDAIRRQGVRQIPVVDADRIVVGLEVLTDFITPPERDNVVVIMAGGLGKRLEELTRETPKPMLPVGPRPLLETIVRSFADQGFRRFYLAVNYKSEQIESHFGDGSRFGVQVHYLREDKRMGTAGALSLLPERPELPFVVTNADLLSRENYASMVDRHTAAGADATMAVRNYEMQVPFGVVRAEGESILGIDEKPRHSFLISAGMYVLSPRVIELIPRNEFFDMPQLFDAAIQRGLHTRCHSIEGYWLDIGRLHDYEQANLDYSKVFR